MPRKAWAQGYFTKHFTTAEGLPHNLCFHVNQDKEGTVWICTDDGMARFDGDGFTRFGKSEGFSSIYPIMATNIGSGKQLVAMWKGEVCEFDGETAKSKSIPGMPIYQNIAFSSDSLAAIYKYGDNTFAIADFRTTPYQIHTSRVVKCIDDKGSESFRLLRDLKRPSLLEKRLTINAFIHLDSLIFFEPSLGLFLLEGDSTLTPLWSSAIKGESITAMDRGSDGIYWLGVNSAILGIKNGKLVRTIKTPAKEVIKRIKVSPTGKVIFSTYASQNSASEGLFYWDPRNEKIIPLHTKLGLKAASTEYFIDRDQNLWIPTHGDGVYFLPLSQLEEFINIPGTFTNKVIETPDGKVWVSGIESLLYFDKNLEETTVIQDEETSIVYVEENEVFFNGAESEGLYSTSSKTRLRASVNNLQKWGTEWFMFDRFHVRTLDILFQNTTTLLRTSRLNINTVLIVNDSTVLAATDLGLRYLRKDIAILPDTILQDTPKSEVLAPLLNMPIYDIYKSRNGFLWIAADGGVYKYYQDSTLIQVGNRQSLPFWSNASLLEDPYGVLWIGTQKGLLRYNGSIFKGIERRTGLLSNEINSMCYTKQGDLWLGTSKGVCVLKNAHANKAFSHPKVPFVIQESALDSTNTLQRGRVFSLSLKAKAFMVDNLTKTQYKLDDGPWTYFNTTLTLTKISSGKHRLHLRGRLAHTEWYELSPFSFKKTPWWQSAIWLSTIAGTLLLGLLIAIYYNFRLKKEKHYNKRLEKEITEREEAEAALGKIRQDIARDYHDELGNHLASITVLSSMAKKYFKAGRDETPQVLDKIADSSKQLHAITKDFLWSIEGKWHHLDELVVYLADKGNSFFEPLDIDFEIVKDDDEGMNSKLPISVGRNVLLIFKEAMTNVGKYAQANKVVLRVNSFDDHWVISLENNGLIIPIADKINSRGLSNMRKRAENIGAELLLKSDLTRLTYKHPSITEANQS